MNKVKLGDICDIGSSKRIHLADYVKKGIPFYRSKEIIELSLGNNITEPLYISFDKYNEIKKRFPVPKINDILITSVGTIGVSYLVKKENFYFKDGNLTWLRNYKEDLVDILYLSKWLKSKLFLDQIQNNNIGAVQKAITIDYLKKVNLILPDLTTQKKIAAVLSALDDKIEINNKINAELEAMAKTLYDYWFVQFEFPISDTEALEVTDNMASTFKGYKSAGGKMVYNPTLKREIPEGWEVKNIQEIANIVDCLHSKKPDYFYESEKYYLAQLENILDNGQFDNSYKYFVSKSDYEIWTSRIEVQKDDILITNAGRVGANCQLPKNIKCGIGRNITAIRPTTISPTYFHLSFNAFDIQKQIKSNTDQGAFFQSLNVKGIKKLYFIIPNKNTLQSFENKVIKIREKRDLNLKQNQELAQLRDWLLPMLMNGQVTVE